MQNLEITLLGQYGRYLLFAIIIILQFIFRFALKKLKKESEEYKNQNKDFNNRILVLETEFKNIDKALSSK